MRRLTQLLTSGTCSVDATALCMHLLRGCDGSRTCSVDATAHCMQAEDCVRITEECGASELREDCMDARSWIKRLGPYGAHQDLPCCPAS